MNSNMLLFAPLCFLLCWMLPGDPMGVGLSSTSPTNQPVPLSMAEDAVDDMYSGCKQTTAGKVKNTYFKKENTGTFAKVWEKAESCATEKLKQKDPKDKALNKHHMQAICVYTCNYTNFYGVFNDHVRSNRSIYGTSFPFHAMHFWLTSAVRILSNYTKCQTTYRRTNLEFTGEVNKIIRFGFFTSTSYKTTLVSYGNKTCFIITTCSGAYLKHYSYFGDAEQEVLIPPYEMFKITANKPGPDVKELADCKKIYTLKSAGVHSGLNCRAVKC